MLGFIASQMTGLVRQNLVSRTFGTSTEMDAFTAATIVPDLLFSLVAGGALASAFIPMFSSLIEKKNLAKAWKLASAVINLVVFLLAGLCALAALFAPQVVQYGLYALRPDLAPELQTLSTMLLRVVLIAPPIYAISGLMMGILNTHQQFLLPALAPTLNWLGWIIGVVFFAPRWGITGLAWGYVLGAVLHLSIQIPGLWRLAQRKYEFTFGAQIDEVRQVAVLMAPRLLGVAVVQLNFVINTILATAQPEGSLTAIRVAWMVVSVPQVVIAQAIAIASLPTFSAQAARGATTELSSSLVATLRGIILLSLPAAAGLIFLRQPIIAMLFQYGKFDAHSTELVSVALLWYSAGLLGHALVEILSRAYYAMHDTRTPVFIGAAAMGLNAIFSFIFSAWFAQMGWMPHGGLALANSLATALEAVFLLLWLKRRLANIRIAPVGSAILQSTAAVLGMSLALAAWLYAAGSLPAWALAVAGVGLGGLAYGAILLLTGIPEARTVSAWVGRRIAKESK